MAEITKNVEIGEVGGVPKTGRPKLYADHGARQLAYRGRQRERGLHMVWVSLEHLAIVRAMVKAEKEAAETAAGGVMLKQIKVVA